jgi:hypothetical protein
MQSVLETASFPMGYHLYSNTAGGREKAPFSTSSTKAVLSDICAMGVRRSRTAMSSVVFDSCGIGDCEGPGSALDEIPDVSAGIGQVSSVAEVRMRD